MVSPVEVSGLVGRKAPDFSAQAVSAKGEIVDFNLSKELSGQYGLLFFYPLDFTFVCPSELIALNNRIDAFRSRGVNVIGVSIDSHFTHSRWRQTPISDGGIGPVGYPLVADLSHAICRMYGVEHPEAHVAMRAVFLIDKEGVVQVQVVNNLPIGRDIDELIRLVDALQFHEAHGEVCPAGWRKGEKGMLETPEGVASYLAENADNL